MMPAPLAKGLIISVSLLVAAGVAVYENPQVRQWVEESRRKVVVVINEINDELAPLAAQARSRMQRPPFRDASRYEDESPDAVERRRQARQEILQRGRILEEQRKQRTRDLSTERGDNSQVRYGEASTTSVTGSDMAQPCNGLRNRAAGEIDRGTSVATGSPLAANSLPYGHEQEHVSQRYESSAYSCDQAASAPPLPPKPAAYQRHPLQVLTDQSSPHDETKNDIGTNDDQSDTHLIDLTPTTSVFSAGPSSLADYASVTDLHEQSTANNFEADALPQTPSISYASVNEWAENTQQHHPRNLAPPQVADSHESEVAQSVNLVPSSSVPACASDHAIDDETISLASSPYSHPIFTPSGPSEADVASISGLTANMDDVSIISSDFGLDGMSTPSTWTEVGSLAGEE